jgi:RNA polymerase sigma-70 factor (ECF subfamily)
MDRPAPLADAPPDLGEAALVAGLRAGDPATFEALVRIHAGRMLAVIRHFLANEEDAREALQDAFLSAFRAIHRFDGRSQLGTWLHRIAVNAALMKRRTRQRHPEQRIHDLLPDFHADGHRVHPEAEWGKPLDTMLERGETKELVRRSIDQLPEAHREILLLRDIEGLDTEETARLLDVNANTVKTRLHRARQALRTLLDPHFRRDEL